MLFASHGSVLIEQKLARARQRMFLFADDQVPPTGKSSLTDVVSLINKARSFSHGTANNKMQASRLAGFLSDRYLFTVINNIDYGNSPVIASDSRGVSGFDMFMRFYSIGRPFTNSLPTSDGGSILDNSNYLSDSAPPASADMILPCFDKTVPESAFQYKLCAAAASYVNMSASNGGSITTTGKWSTTDSSQVATMTIDQTGMTDYSDLTMNQTIMDVGGISTATTVLSNIQATFGPRMLYSSRTNVYGSYYYSGGGWSYSTTRYKGCYASANIPIEANRYYAPVVKTPTPAYKIKFGFMPISFNKSVPCIVQILTEGVDFTHTQADVPGTRPDITLIAGTAPTYNKTVLM